MSNLPSLTPLTHQDNCTETEDDRTVVGMENFLKSNCFVNVAWWNVGNLYHFLNDQAGPGSRWPSSQIEYDAQLEAVINGLKELQDVAGVPDILFLGEVTAVSASAIQRELFPAYKLVSLDVAKDKPTLQVAVLFNPNKDNVYFFDRLPLVVEGVPRGTRPMAVVDLVTRAFTIRFVGCHWQSRFDEKGSDKTRFRLSDHLAMKGYDFLNKCSGYNHLVIVGDLNEEPFEHNLDTLFAHRHRSRSKAKSHWADHDSKRVHLYNTSWRMLGEKHPHFPGSKFDGGCAGTFYWESERSWHHFDHIIVSGGLLSEEVPYLNEDEVSIVASPKFLHGGIPVKFKKSNDGYVGLSDHLPVVARIYI